MDDRNNTIMGWVLGAGIVALGLGSLTGHLWAPHEAEKMGYAIEGAAPAGGAAAGPAIETLLQTADAAKGEAVFAKCAACHNIAQGGANGIGPNLWATMGKPIAGHAGYAYSAALSGKGGNWDWANMSEWLASPRRFADGTKMSFAGLSSAEDRASLMVYMNAQGSNIPLPAPPAAAGADGAATDGAADGAVDAAAAAAPVAGSAAGGAGDPAQAGGAAPMPGAAPAAPGQAATKNSRTRPE